MLKCTYTQVHIIALKQMVSYEYLSSLMLSAHGNGRKIKNAVVLKIKYEIYEIRNQHFVNFKLFKT